MIPEARHLIELARQARTPTAEDRLRVRAAIGLSVAAASVIVPTSAAVATAKAGGLMGLFGGVRFGLSAMLLASASVGGGAYYWWAASSRAHRSAEIQAAKPEIGRASC